MNNKQPLQVYLEAAKQACGVDQKDIFSPIRQRPVSNARKIYAWLARMDGHTVTAIGNYIKKDHSSIVYANKVFPSLYRSNKRFKSLADKAQKILQ